MQIEGDYYSREAPTLVGVKPQRTRRDLRGLRDWGGAGRAGAWIFPRGCGTRHRMGGTRSRALKCEFGFKVGSLGRGGISEAA